MRRGITAWHAFLDSFFSLCKVPSFQHQRLSACGFAKPVFCLPRNADESLPDPGGGAAAMASTREENELPTLPDKAGIACSSQVRPIGDEGFVDQQSEVRREAVGLSKDSEPVWVDKPAIPEDLNQGIRVSCSEARSGSVEDETVEIYDVDTGEVEEHPWKKRKISERCVDQETDVSETVRRKRDFADDEDSEDAVQLSNAENSGVDTENAGGNASEATRGVEGRRRLPRSILGANTDIDAQRPRLPRSLPAQEANPDTEELSAWDILNLIMKDCEEDEPVTGSFLEIGKRYGIL